jgi:hypothetical protein
MSKSTQQLFIAIYFYKQNWTYNPNALFMMEMTNEDEVKQSNQNCIYNLESTWAKTLFGYSSNYIPD